MSKKETLIENLDNVRADLNYMAAKTGLGETVGWDQKSYRILESIVEDAIAYIKTTKSPEEERHRFS